MSCRCNTIQRTTCKSVGARFAIPHTGSQGMHLNRPEYPIFLSPMLRHRLCGHPTRLSGSTRPTIMLLPIPSGHRTPSLPVAKYITLSRIATPWSVDKRYEDRFTRGLRSHFEQERGVGSRLIKQGDVVAIPILEEVEDSDVEHMPK